MKLELIEKIIGAELAEIRQQLLASEHEVKTVFGEMYPSVSKNQEEYYYSFVYLPIRNHLQFCYNELQRKLGECYGNRSNQ